MSDKSPHKVLYVKLSSRVALDWLCKRERRKLCDQLDWVLAKHIQDNYGEDYHALTERLIAEAMDDQTVNPG